MVVVVAGPVMTNERSSADQFRPIAIFPANPAPGQAATERRLTFLFEPWLDDLIGW